MSNDEGTVESACKLTVKKPEITFTKGLEDQTVEKGATVTLSIEVSTPVKEVKW